MSKFQKVNREGAIKKNFTNNEIANGDGTFICIGQAANNYSKTTKLVYKDIFGNNCSSSNLQIISTVAKKANQVIDVCEREENNVKEIYDEITERCVKLNQESICNYVFTYPDEPWFHYETKYRNRAFIHALFDKKWSTNVIVHADYGYIAHELRWCDYVAKTGDNKNPWIS